MAKSPNPPFSPPFLGKTTVVAELDEGRDYTLDDLARLVMRKGLDPNRCTITVRHGKGKCILEAYEAFDKAQRKIILETYEEKTFYGRNPHPGQPDAN